MENILEILNNNSGIAIIISSLAVILSVCTLMVSTYYNYHAKKHIFEGKKPSLSFKMIKEEGLIYLILENKGGMAAEKVKINLVEISGNGENPLFSSSTFYNEFDIYPGEVIKDNIAIFGENLATGKIYPKVIMKIEYNIPGVKKRVSIERSISLTNVYDLKVQSDVKFDIKNIESALSTQSNSLLRLSNYFMGKTYSEIDNVNTIMDTSFVTELVEELSNVIKKF